MGSGALGLAKASALSVGSAAGMAAFAIGPIRRARAEAAYRGAQARVDYLEKKAASIRNPLLPRPTPTEEDGIEEAGMDNAARLTRTLEQKEQAERALQRAAQVVAVLGGKVRAPAKSGESPGAEPESPAERRTLTVAGGGD